MIFTPGIAVGQMSGSVGGITASHNKGGPYFRNRAIPTNPNTAEQLAQRNRLATLSRDWQDLTQAQRDAWTEWARQNPITNALGNSILKSGHQSFVGLNSNILRAGSAAISVPPIIAAPDGFTTATQDGDIGVGDVDLTFAGSLTSGNQIILFGAVTNSAGIFYVENLYRFIAFSAVDQSTPWDNESDIIAVVGALTVNQTLHIKAAQFDVATGQNSTFLRSDVVITSTA